MNGRIHSIESFGTVDGPGVRMVIFFQGCPMRCAFCHNPDTWPINAGTEMTAEEILERFLRNRSYYRNGGITATGGEPLLQLAFLTELFEKAKKAGISTCLDTSGICFPTENEENSHAIEEYEKLLAVTDLVLLDIKHTDDNLHKKLTGHSNEAVLSFLKFLHLNHTPVWIRRVLVPGYTMDDAELRKLGTIIGAYDNVKSLEVLPYHTMGISKYEQLGISYRLTGVKVPDKESVEEAKKRILEGVTSVRKRK